MANNGIQWHHGISDDVLKKIGEVIVQWSAADSFVANSLNYLFHVGEEALRREICAWSMSKKLHLLRESPRHHPQRKLVDEVCRRGLACIGERNRVAHSLATLDVDGQPFLEGPKDRHRVEPASIQVYLDHARQVCNLALVLNMALAAPWTVKTAWSSGDPDF